MPYDDPTRDQDALEPCCADQSTVASRAIVLPTWQSVTDETDPIALAREARRRAAGTLDRVTDAHVHLWPTAVYQSLWRWFDDHAWRIAFRGDAEATLGALQSAGVSRVVSLVYAHRPGIARGLNAFAAQLARAHPEVVALGTVLPGESDARDVVDEALGPLGLRGIKLHCHVQKLAIDDPRVMAVLAQCERADAVAVVHCGREPATDAYGVDTHTICHVSRCERVLRAFPRLKLIVPHVGADEYEAYFALMDRHENLYLDTSMACAEYFEHRPDWAQVEAHAERMLYGTDFPITPYELDRERTILARRIVSDTAFESIVRGTAARLFPL
ncbi:MAG: amidohydrolase family protein [Deltaproteobacteria bacterium]|nr:amidohydrolase family protein [Deltaproteobacteria bacterium]